LKDYAIINNPAGKGTYYIARRMYSPETSYVIVAQATCEATAKDVLRALTAFEQMHEANDGVPPIRSNRKK